MWKKVKNFWKEAPRKYPNAPLYIAGAAVVLQIIALVLKTTW